MSKPWKLAIVCTAAALLSGCEVVDSLFASGDAPAAPAAVASAEPAILATPVPDDGFCKGAAESAARPGFTPNFFTPEGQKKEYDRVYRECMEVQVNRR
jgi:hypothetical protein